MERNPNYNMPVPQEESEQNMMGPMEQPYSPMQQMPSPMAPPYAPMLPMTQPYPPMNPYMQGPCPGMQTYCPFMYYPMQSQEPNEPGTEVSQRRFERHRQPFDFDDFFFFPRRRFDFDDFFFFPFFPHRF